MGREKQGEGEELLTLCPKHDGGSVMVREHMATCAIRLLVFTDEVTSDRSNK